MFNKQPYIHSHAYTRARTEFDIMSSLILDNARNSIFIYIIYHTSGLEDRNKLFQKAVFSSLEIVLIKLLLDLSSLSFKIFKPLPFSFTIGMKDVFSLVKDSFYDIKSIKSFKSSILCLYLLKSY